jgi:hypothetical protein
LKVLIRLVAGGRHLQGLIATGDPALHSGFPKKVAKTRECAFHQCGEPIQCGTPLRRALGMMEETMNTYCAGG